MFGMFLTLKIDTLLNRFAIRNDVKHEIKLQNGKLKCDCKDALFVSVPCRHLLALVTKEKELSQKVFLLIIDGERITTKKKKKRKRRRKRKKQIFNLAKMKPIFLQTKSRWYSIIFFIKHYRCKILI